MSLYISYQCKNKEIENFQGEWVLLNNLTKQLDQQYTLSIHEL